MVPWGDSRLPPVLGSWAGEERRLHDDAVPGRVNVHSGVDRLPAIAAPRLSETNLMHKSHDYTKRYGKFARTDEHDKITRELNRLRSIDSSLKSLGLFGVRVMLHWALPENRKRGESQTNAA